MWDTVQTNQQHLSHDRPCSGCGHGAHSYLPCSETCSCEVGRAATARPAAPLALV